MINCLYALWERCYKDKMTWKYFYRVARPFEGKVKKIRLKKEDKIYDPGVTLFGDR